MKIALTLLTFVPAMHAHAQDLSEMTGCWQSRQFDSTSLLFDASNPRSAEILTEKMLLRFEQIKGTDYLVFGRVYEWDKAGTYVLGPTYQNGAFNPAGRFLTFGFPQGGLDHVTLTAPDQLLYVHTKSSFKSAMSVRTMVRIDCGEFEKLEEDLLKRQENLR